MGAVIKRRDLLAVIEQAQQGLFVLDPKVTVPVNAPVMNIGLVLGERLYKAKVDGLSVNIPIELDTILGEDYHDIILENTDILFTPEYELDVLKLLLQVGRNQRLFILWPGEIDGVKLTYSEPGRFDFKEYIIKDYIDTYIILR